ncbi:MAG: metal ABC transporter permease [Bacillota bacterium]
MLEALRYEFMQNALAAGVLAAVACGLIGSFVVVKKMVSISGGISHASFGGVGLGYWLGINPVLGALFFTVAASLGMGLAVKKTRLAEDTAIGILWAMGMATGIIFLRLTPGYAPDLFSYLFGNILLVTSSDLTIMLSLDLIIVAAVGLLYKELVAVSFDEEFARIARLPVNCLYLGLLCLIALTVVILIKVVGIILVIALLTIPAALARQFTPNLKKMMLISILLGAAFSLGGLWFSYQLDLPSGATIILLGGVAFFLAAGIARARRSRGRSGKECPAPAALNFIDLKEGQKL